MNLRNQKGINMITLSVAVIILVIITSILVYNAKDGTKIKSLNNLYNDIEQLNNKVSSYYLKNGDIPKGDEYTEVAFIENLDDTQKNPNNEGKYYVINLNALEGVSLNYGKRFSNPDAEANDIYIINDVSHTIYYVRGIKVEDTTYYTVPDEWEKIELSSFSKITIEEFKIEGTPVTTPPIPSGYCYVGGTIDTGYVISDNVADANKYVSSEDVGTDLVGNQFVWVPVDQNQVISLKVTSTENITEMKLYDPYGDEINLGTVSGKTYENTNITPTINGGYYLKVTTAGESKTAMLSVRTLYAVDPFNDYWSSDEYINYTVNEWYEGSIEDFLSDYGYSSIEEYKESQIDNKWMKRYIESTDTIDYAGRIAANGGFYIGRYEATYSSSGVLSKPSTSTRTSNSTTLIDSMLWNYIDQPEALSTAKAYDTGLNSSLLTGAAWDRTLGWLVETNNKTIEQVCLSNKSSDWGNGTKDTFSGTTGLINTGEFSQTKANNIYDLVGNLWEWTSEAGGVSIRVLRGGIYFNGGSYNSAIYRHSFYVPSSKVNYEGFRLALYL